MKVHRINSVFAGADAGATICRYEQRLGLRRQPWGLSEFEVKDLNGCLMVLSELID
jgi:hypothetical protein